MSFFYVGRGAVAFDHGRSVHTVVEVVVKVCVARTDGLLTAAVVVVVLGRSVRRHRQGRDCLCWVFSLVRTAIWGWGGVGEVMTYRTHDIHSRASNLGLRLQW